MISVKFFFYFLHEIKKYKINETENKSKAQFQTTATTKEKKTRAKKNPKINQKSTCKGDETFEKKKKKNGTLLDHRKILPKF